MPAERDDAQTQPLPVVTQPRARRTPLKPVAGYGILACLLGGALLYVEYTPDASNAPRLVRGAVWAASAGFLFLGVAAFGCAVAIALVDAVLHAAREGQRTCRERRDALQASGSAALAQQRAEHWSLAEQAAGMQRPGRDATVLDLAGSRRRGGPHTRRGAAS